MTETMAYTGACPGCGNVVAVSVDKPEYRRENAKFVAQLVRDGLQVGRVTVAQARELLVFCACQPNPRKRKTRTATATATQVTLNV